MPIFTVEASDTSLDKYTLVKSDLYNNLYRSSDGTYLLKSYTSPINYLDEFGEYQEINLSHMIITDEYNYYFNSAPYIFSYNYDHYTFWLDRNDEGKGFIEVYFPEDLIAEGTDYPCYKDVPHYDNGLFIWDSQNFKMQVVLNSVNVRFEYILYNQFALTDFNMRIKFNVQEDYLDDVNFFSCAYDNSGRKIPILTEYDGENLHIRVILDGDFRPEFPVTIDPSISLYSLLQDCSIYGSNADYPTVWNALSGTLSNVSSSIIGQRLTLGTYTIYRSFLYFNTNNAIPIGSEILSSSINIYVTSTFLGTKRVRIQYNNNSNMSPHNPPNIYDYNRANYSGDGGSKKTFSTMRYNAIPLNATGLSWINRTGITKFCLRTSTDITGTQPTGNERITYYSANMPSTTYDPYLEITFRIFVNTSVNPVYYVQTWDTVNISCDYDIHTNSIELLYRYADFSTLYDLDNAFFNFSYITNYADYDNYIWFAGLGMDFYFQTFKSTDSAYIKNISCIVNESLDAEAQGTISIYTLDINGNPDNWIGTSINTWQFTTIPSYWNFEFNPYVLINANTDYAIVLSLATLMSFPDPAPDPNRVYLWYNTSDCYDNGYMGFCNGVFPPTYTHYLTNDFPFKINYSWLYYDTETYPFLFDFNPPKNDNIYRLSSIGSNTTFPSATETINDNHDIEFLYVEKGVSAIPTILIIPTKTDIINITLGIIIALPFCMILWIRKKRKDNEGEVR
jgi:hypothetical protein